ncbi:MAG: hypothetical protein KY467_08030 [Gemmatimonadetes bacterium]|nr:hypothetical protein [Gemmatimonadota bacterium]
MARRALDPAQLKVETFPTTAVTAAPANADCTWACDTDYDCSTVCDVDTNVSSPC